MMPLCNGCKFYQPTRPSSQGFCHRFPPRATKDGSIFPRITALDWCGEHKLAEMPLTKDRSHIHKPDQEYIAQVEAADEMESNRPEEATYMGKTQSADDPENNKAMLRKAYEDWRQSRVSAWYLAGAVGRYLGYGGTRTNE